MAATTGAVSRPTSDTYCNVVSSLEWPSSSAMRYGSDPPARAASVANVWRNWWILASIPHDRR